MSPRSRAVHAVLAGVGAFLVELWPLLLIWRAGASGSVGDLREERLVVLGVAYALVVAAVVARLMSGALAEAARSPDRGRLDPWGAWAVGVGLYNLALTALPAVMYALLLGDEDQSLRSREWLVYLLWIGGHLTAGVVGVVAARLWFGTDRTRGEVGPA